MKVSRCILLLQAFFLAPLHSLVLHTPSPLPASLQEDSRHATNAGDLSPSTDEQGKALSAMPTSTHAHALAMPTSLPSQVLMIGGDGDMQLATTKKIEGRGLSCVIANSTINGDGTFPLATVSNCSDLAVINVTFLHGVSVQQGGCLQLQDVPHLHIESSQFRDCHAVEGGGAVTILPSSYQPIQSVHLHGVIFDSTSVTAVNASGGGGSVEVAAGGSCLLAYVYDNNTVITMSDVVVRNSSQLVSSTSPSFYPNITGGCFVFVWPVAHSGIGVQVSLSNLSFDMITSAVHIRYQCVNSVHCYVSSSLFLLAFMEEYSGSDLHVQQRVNVALCELHWYGGSGNGVGFGAYWSSPHSGNSLVYEVEGNMSLHSSILSNWANIFTFWWSGDASGMNPLLLFASHTSWSLFDVSFSGQSVWFYLGWNGAFSGMNVRISFDSNTAQMLVSTSL
mmetsp:Transcript_43873/g.114399  ORF Transcript_43873/g.114399 Transcript_43873/m.114399 type:complete len:449 (-) Transcript_43873:5788-7134(-)